MWFWNLCLTHLSISLRILCFEIKFKKRKKKKSFNSISTTTRAKSGAVWMGFQSQSQSLLSSPVLDDDDDFQIPLSLTQASLRKPLKPTNSTRRPSKKPKRAGKENVNVPGPTATATATQSQKSLLHDFESSDLIGCCSSSLDSIRSSIVDCTDSTVTDEKKGLMTISGGYLCNSIESRLLNSAVDNVVVGGSENEMGEELDLLLNLCADSQQEEDLVRCPLCGIDISDMSNQQRQIHTNQCLDKDQTQPQLQQHVISWNSLFCFSYLFVYILNANIWGILFRLFFRMMMIKVNLNLLGKWLMFLLFSCGCAASV